MHPSFPLNPVRPLRPVLAMAVGLLAAVSGCMHASTASRGADGTDPFEEPLDETRETVLIEPHEDAESFDITPAVFDTALIRVQAAAGSGAMVEVLIKGSFPEGCLELNELDQEPTSDGQDVELTMRRPSNAVCTQVVRPYRFFFTLDRRFEAGHHTLTVNGRSFDFEVTAH